MSVTSSFGSDTYSDGFTPATEGLLTLQPKFPPVAPLPGVQFVHGAGSTATYCLDTLGNQAPLTRKIVAAGFSAIAGDNAGQQSWGNPASLSRVAANLAKVAAMPNVTSDYMLVSGSMGGLVSLNYAAQAAVKPRAIVSVIPVINLNDVVVNNRGGLGALASSAHGGYVESTMGITRNPYTMRAMPKLQGIPMLFFYGLTDTLCLPQWMEAFAAADPENRTIVAMPSGHDYTSYDLVDHDRIVQFLRDNTATGG